MRSCHIRNSQPYYGMYLIVWMCAFVSYPKQSTLLWHVSYSLDVCVRVISETVNPIMACKQLASLASDQSSSSSVSCGQSDADKPLPSLCFSLAEEFLATHMDCPPFLWMEESAPGYLLLLGLFSFFLNKRYGMEY